MSRFTSAVVLDTDIGSDIDDCWALAMLLRCPELDPRLVVTCTGDTAYRAQVAGAILAAGGRADVPLATGPPTSLSVELPPGLVGPPQQGLASGYRLAEHPGGVRADGVQALVDSIMESSEPVTLVAIGPMTNVAAALDLEPRIVERARLVAMLGSVRRGLLGKAGGEPEYNVAADVPACRAALAADWEVTITPLDSCGAVVLDRDRYERLLRGSDPLVRKVLDAYREWDERMLVSGVLDWVGYRRGMSGSRSTILFDTMAVYLAYSESLLEIETLPIAVEDDGSTRVVDGAPDVRVAVECDLEPFLDHLTDRLLMAGPVR